MNPLQRYRDFLASRGRPLRLPAATVVEAAFTLEGTFSAEDLFVLLGGKASRATVYRTLDILTQADLLRKVRFNGGEVFVAPAGPDRDELA